MSKKSTDSELEYQRDLKLLYLMLQPTRAKIIQSLQHSSKYAKEIAREIEIDRRIAFWHLETLRKYGLALREYRLIKYAKSKPPAVAAFYELTPEVERIRQRFAEKFPF